MVLKKISSIKDHKIFRDFEWERDVGKNQKDEFKDLNLIYGWNGSGKTTLTNLFFAIRRLQKNMKTDQPIDITQEIEWLTTGKIYFDKLLLSDLVDDPQKVSSIRVFNEEFVKQNIKSDELLETFIIGEGNIDTHQFLIKKNKELLESVNLYQKTKENENKILQSLHELENTIHNNILDALDTNKRSISDGFFKGKILSCMSVEKKDTLTDKEFEKLQYDFWAEEQATIEYVDIIFEIEMLYTFKNLHREISLFLEEIVSASILEEALSDENLSMWLQTLRNVFWS